ncbi:MAG: phosphatase PAP2 family protein [Bacteroidetes bacterium]|nr:phosphatase PAP2 family protein [Bacteroidota bacterium]
MRHLSILVSWVFHPLLLCTYLVILLTRFLPHFLLIPTASIWMFIGLVFIMTFVLPVLNLLMFKTFGSLHSLQMHQRRDRIVPFVLISIIYAVVAWMFYYKISTNVNFNKVMLIVAVLVVTATVITFFEKISVHSMAAGGMAGIIIPLNKVVADNSLLWPSVFIIVIAGAVMSARLYLNAHTLRQVMYGGAAGLMIGLTGMLLLFRGH